MKRVGLLALLALLVAAPLAAQDSLETAKRRELDEINRQAREKREAARALKGQETQALTQLRRTESELTSTRRRLRALDQRRRNLDQQLEITRVDLERNSQSLGQQRSRLARRLRNLYKFGAARELEFLLSTSSFGQLLARWDFLVMVAEQDRMLLEDIELRKTQVETAEQRLETNLTDIRKNATKTSRENDRLATLRQTRQSSVKTIQSQRESYEAAAAQLERDAKALANLLAALDRKRRDEANKARAEGRTPQPYTGDFARGRGALDWPVRGAVIGHFGPETHPKWGTTTLNNGIDIQAPLGAAVHAVARGRVDYTSDDYAGYGQIVIVNHGDGYYTLYAHLSDILVSTNQEVVPGQVIGKVGDTGSLKGVELHFEVRKGGSALNPEDWLQ
ncbi:MAG TPA: peptidoglycan DD-metalloendopeptidase family protein [Candidatus Saccharimonadaceae bacterium]|jgi:septal ring factor EnvC (AmiA/AmiB activator)|nr:peptidoglycan DD-metalloendopeptidase family protein [Candidatus Saccharimonadaceae bacterium]